jgi:hypothetical protein
MKEVRTSLRALLVGGAIVAGLAAVPEAQAQEAQQARPDRAPREQAVGTPAERAEARLGELTAALRLSATQAAQVRPILVKRYTDSEALRSASRQGGGADLRAQRETLVQNTNTAILAVLNAEQKAAYQALLEREQSRRPDGAPGDTRGPGARGGAERQS